MMELAAVAVVGTIVQVTIAVTMIVVRARNGVVHLGVGEGAAPAAAAAAAVALHNRDIRVLLGVGVVGIRRRRIGVVRAQGVGEFLPVVRLGSGATPTGAVLIHHPLVAVRRRQDALGEALSARRALLAAAPPPLRVSRSVRILLLLFFFLLWRRRLSRCPRGAARQPLGGDGDGGGGRAAAAVAGEHGRVSQHRRHAGLQQGDARRPLSPTPVGWCLLHTARVPRRLRRVLLRRRLRLVAVVVLVVGRRRERPAVAPGARRAPARLVRRLYLDQLPAQRRRRQCGGSAAVLRGLVPRGAPRRVRRGPLRAGALGVAQVGAGRRRQDEGVVRVRGGGGGGGEAVIVCIIRRHRVRRLEHLAVRRDVGDTEGLHHRHAAAPAAGARIGR
ncbi:hypothetical protein STCU_10520 [Strigomonas culicis]|uniref:Uncharacterized protein n=1 Tax=Strigomonas culicis TaxID=28005 RepID=S9TLA7_9TRYP|nr:hypothetical protein STCU_10520 [Strigomonas culicis]|eukprot:EPY17579.1 hypothetical protein STCU_10520 [Strigomonas culicis]